MIFSLYRDIVHGTDHMTHSSTQTSICIQFFFTSANWIGLSWSQCFDRKI